ncbi:toll-like receptor 4 isoform X2 [Physella acuta]|uniref:toll-like receptor 4 isoform X2 n=1 Tax=Physella acuta TaxID=109671 RepID=UPI0027DE4D01|nr:toll-like receptor 4 isoform X2 [Physella acuta]
MDLSWHFFLLLTATIQAASSSTESELSEAGTNFSDTLGSHSYSTSPPTGAGWGAHPPIDYFRCEPCKCHHLANLSISADCSTLALGTVPLGLPDRTTRLVLSSCDITAFKVTSLLEYKYLGYLDLSNNKMSRLSNTSNAIQCKVSVSALDLSSNKISTIDDGALWCFPQLTTLNLQQNELVYLGNRTLHGAASLRQLDLSYNRLHSLGLGVFDPVPQLRVLRLGHNNNFTYGYNRFHPRIFQPLQQLEVLYAQHLYPSNTYPLAALAVLTQLRELSLDGSDHSFVNTSLRHLDKLTSLLLGVDGLCSIKILSKSFFHDLPQLRSIHIEGCPLSNISEEAFDKNIDLEKINLTLINLSLGRIFQGLGGLKNASVRSLTLSKIRAGHMDACAYLSQQEAAGLRDMTHLEELYLENNGVSFLTHGFLRLLPTSIKVLSVSGNLLTHGRSLLATHKPKAGPELLPNLVSLREDMQDTVVYHGVAGAAAPEQCSGTSGGMGGEEDDRSDDSQFGLDVSANPQVNLPTGLQEYSAVHSFHFGSEAFSGGRKKRLKLGNLKILNISNTFFTQWGSKKLESRVQVADLSNNFCQSLSQTFLNVQNSLVTLLASGNYLGHDLAADIQGEKLSRGQKVKHLDLSNNRLQDLPEKVFQGLVSLQVLTLSYNDIHSINIRLAHMKHLLLLDLSRNSISWIGQRMRDDLDQIALNHSVSLDLSSNPLPCTCDGLDVLRWLAMTNVRILHRDYLYCLDQEKRQSYIGNASQKFHTLQKLCLSQKYIFVITSFTAAFLFFIFSSIVIFKKRWWLYYMRSVIIARVYGFRPRLEPARFKFDAYIVYSTADVSFVFGECLQELEVKRGHKLCLEDRDFLIGSFIPCNITSAISSSRLTVAVISRDFWEGEWTEYSVQMALVEHAQSKRKVLHLLTYKDVSAEDLPRELLKVYTANDFSEYPPADCNNDVKAAFWDSFSQTIGHQAGEQ